MSILPAAKIAGGPHVMGIVNLTPDSFSDGGKHRDVRAAIDAACAMLEAGADIIDVGGESTRPGAAPVAGDDELRRVLPMIEGLRKVSAAPISIDTMKPAVAEAALAAGATLWNDVNALQAPGALDVAARLRAPVVLMHMQGAPRTMQADPRYGDVVVEVSAFLAARANAARAAGVRHIWIDPGIGFGKTLAHNLALMRALPAIAAAANAPLLFGASRKSFIQKIDATAGDARDRLGGSIAAALHAARAGAAIVRVHDVRETVQALQVMRALEGEA
jgi:dihydropteroate synthase